MKILLKLVVVDIFMILSAFDYNTKKMAVHVDGCYIALY